MKKTTLLFICLLSVLNISAEVYTGSCGENVKYSLDTETGVLKIIGTGAMNNYYYYGGTPWFYQRSYIKTVEISGGVTSIGDIAFPYCINLTSVIIPNSVTSIGNSAFYECTNLDSIIIPGGVTTIGSRAFYRCSSLPDINIPSSVSDIYTTAFEGCSSLKKITVDANNVVYDSRDNCNAIIRTMDNILWIGCKNTIIPNTISYIGSYAFSGCSGLTYIEIPESVLKIYNNAFNDCTHLNSIIIKNDRISISNDAFDNTALLNTHQDDVIYFGNILYKYNGYMPENTSIKVNDGTTNINSDAFNGFIGLTSIEIPNSVTHIGSGAFAGCRGLKSITLPDALKEIESSTFYGCSDLNTIVIPNNVQNIQTSAFSGCTSLTSIGLSYNIKSIGGEAFTDCRSLTSIYFPSSVQEIGAFAFSNCYKLKTVIFEEGNDELIFKNVNYSVNTFNNCQLEKVYMGRTMYFWPLNISPFMTCNVDSVIIGANIQSSNTYRKCYDFFTDCKYIEIKKEVTSVPSEFSRYPNLTEIIVEEGNSVYDSRNNCNAIIRTDDNTLCVGCKNTIIPNTIKNIGSYAFSECLGLTSVNIPESVRKIDSYAFMGCQNLNDVFCYGMPSTIATNIFDGTDIGKSTLHVPSSLLEAFNLVSPWNIFGSIVALPEPALRGDVNGDEVVNGTDIQAIINFIVAGEYDEKADVNEDGVVNGTDIQEVINIIVNTE